jgi:glycosyltransferase involved in cell wall biosynthesis
MVLPVHNGGAFVAQAIESVLAQSFEDFELICVDDASSDETPRILTAFAARDPRVRVVTHSVNKGLPAALNRGFSQARGELHSWTSDDNLLRPQMLERLVGALDANRDVDIVHAAYTVIDAEGNSLSRVTVGPVDSLIFGNNVGACFLYRATVTEAIGGYDEALFGVEDYDFWLRAARRFRFVALADDLYLYRRHGGSLTDRKARTIHRLCVQLVERETALLEDTERTAHALLSLALKTRVELRFDLVARALLLAPAMVMRRAYGISRWAGGAVWHKLRAIWKPVSLSLGIVSSDLALTT